MTTTLGLSDDDLSDTFCDQNDELLFSRISDDLSKHGYSVNVNALPLALAEQLSQHISAISDDSFKQASIGRNKGRSNNLTVRSQRQSWISNDSLASSNWLKWASELQCYLNQHLYLGLSTFESHYAHYRPGDFYKRHLDSFRGQSSRRLSIVIYLNRDWLSTDGGELIMYADNEDLTGLRIIPSFATVVVFLSEEHPHEVLAAHRDRYSIAGWYSPTLSTNV
ncbi:MAG: 2OG-Fe(II) oxygenase [Arenicella sp.]|nr:2OG-Fe(II) oxygenase [Arenicella sp.]